jgi:hypothetical protein
MIPVFDAGATRRRIIDQGFKTTISALPLAPQQDFASSEPLALSDLLRIQNKRDAPNDLNHSSEVPSHKKMKANESAYSDANIKKDNDHKTILSGKFVSDTLMRAVEKACLDLRRTIPKDELVTATESVLITFYDQIHSIHSGKDMGSHTVDDEGIIRSNEESFPSMRLQIDELHRMHEEEKKALDHQYKADIDLLKQEHEKALVEIIDQHKEEIRRLKDGYHRKFVNYLDSTRESLKIVRGSML